MVERRVRAAIFGVVFVASMQAALAVPALAGGHPGAPGWVQNPICTTPPVPPDVTGITYSSPDGSAPLTVDVYQAPGAGLHPSLLMVHGGSWKSGCKGVLATLADRFRQTGFTVFDLAYRTDCKPARPPATLDDPTYCKGIGIPFEVDDVHSAMLWIRANAGSYGGDPARVASMGPSTGGHLVLFQAARDAGTTAPPPVVQARP